MLRRRASTRCSHRQRSARSSRRSAAASGAMSLISRRCVITASLLGGGVPWFGLGAPRVRFRPIKGVIRYPLDEVLYEVKTAYGRSIRVTGSHSIFVEENGEVRLKKGGDLRVGDQVVAPKSIQLPQNAPKRIDLLRELH